MSNPVWSAAAVGGLVSAIITLLVAFGVTITQDQTAAIMGVLATGMPFAIAWYSARKVTSLSNPKDEDDTPLVRADTLQPTRSAERAAAKRAA